MTSAEAIAGLATLLAYIATCVVSIRFAKRSEPLKKWPLLIPGLIGLLSNIALAAVLVHHKDGTIINFSSTMALFGAVLSCVGAAALLSDQSRIIGAFTYPLTFLMTLLAILTYDSSTAPVALSIGVLTHVVLSLLAYGLLTLSMTQAAALFFQIRALKSPEHLALIKILPPLHTMEKFLFILLCSGWLLLTCAIISGWLFVEDLFTQHLTHKAVLTLLSWLIFGSLIFGHIKFGWRGKKAVAYVSAGFMLLLLAYFGSKFVLEILLNR